VSDRFRMPSLAFSSAIDRLRRLPVARSLAPVAPWIDRVLFLGAFVLLLVWMGEVSPQRITLAELAEAKLGQYQSWIIVSGDLGNEVQSTSGGFLYRLTDKAAPNAELAIRSSTRLSLGPTTVSGRIEGGRDPVQPGYHWSASLDADAQLASEQPPPVFALLLAGIGLSIAIARRTTYPMFVSEAPGPAMSASARLRVVAHGAGDDSGVRDVEGILALKAGVATAELHLPGIAPRQVRLHSAFTNLDVGVLRWLSSSEPALRVLASGDVVTLGFATRRDRDSAFATLFGGTQPRSSRTSAA
jgi:hypothetical protein